MRFPEAFARLRRVDRMRIVLHAGTAHETRLDAPAGCNVEHCELLGNADRGKVCRQHVTDHRYRNPLGARYEQGGG